MPFQYRGDRMAGSGSTSGPSASPRAEDQLESWKEIAAYLKRDERTVRRWEQQEGLPVRRHVHQRQASVYAYKSELDAWRNGRRVTSRNNWFRLALGGVLWCIIYNGLMGAAWFSFLHSAGVPSSHPLLGRSSPPVLIRVVSLILLTLAMGLSGMYLYAGMRSRYGARPRTILLAGLALWWLWGLMPALPEIHMRTAPLGRQLVELTSKLIIVGLATAVGASFYREATLSPPARSGKTPA